VGAVLSTVMLTGAEVLVLPAASRTTRTNPSRVDYAVAIVSQSS
jgi:hypothetical protein